MAAKPSSGKRSTDEPKSELAVSYNEFKEYEGQCYTGMKIGRSHKWYYDRGEWKETKITPDLWQIGYAVTNPKPASAEGRKARTARPRVQRAYRRRPAARRVPGQRYARPDTQIHRVWRSSL